VKDLARIVAFIFALAPSALFVVAAQAQTAPKPTADERIQRLVSSISEERLQSIVVKLASFGTRNTLSDETSPTRGIGAARQWIFDELKRSSPKLRVSFDTYQIAPQGRIPRTVELRNIIAILPGRTDRRIYITGHYDSVNLGPGVSAALATAAPATPEFDGNANAPGATTTRAASR